MATGSAVSGGSKVTIDSVQISAANANRDGTGTIVDAKVAGAYGSAVTSVEIQAVGTTTAGMIRAYAYNGAAYRLLTPEVPVSAITPSATVAAFTATWAPVSALNLPVGWKLGFSTEKAETFNLITKGLDY